MSDWQPIETAPKNEQVLVSDGVYRTIAVDWSGGYGWVDEDGRLEVQPTHWMPLPDVPKKRQAEP